MYMLCLLKVHEYYLIENQIENTGKCSSCKESDP